MSANVSNLCFTTHLRIFIPEIFAGRSKTSTFAATLNNLFYLKIFYL